MSDTAVLHKKITKKQSLSILSSSALNQINNQQHENVKPAKERIISESTGLIKFSIKKPLQKDSSNYNKQNNVTTSTIKNPSIVDTTPAKKNMLDSSISNGMPIYIPIDTDSTHNTRDDEQELLFKMAAQQRKVLDLTEQLKHANEKLTSLENQYKKFTNNIGTGETTQDAAPVFPTATKVTSTLKKSTSLMNINSSKINAQEQIIKTQKQVTDTFNQLSANLANNNFLTKSKTFFEESLSKNIQMGNEIFNSIFEKQNEVESDNSEEILLEEETQHFEYSVDYDIDRLSKVQFNKKLQNTILEDLEEDDEFEFGEISVLNGNKLRTTKSNESEISETDYGGQVANI